MKNNIKKLLAIALAIIALLSLSVSAFAADISADAAKEIALKDAGCAAGEVIFIKAEYDIDDSVKQWNIDFLVEDESGRKIDYDYEIAASDGRIIEKDWDYEDSYPDADDKFENIFEDFFRKLVAWLVSLFSK